MLANNPSNYINKAHKVYLAYKDEHNLSMQDIKTERESEQSQTQGICFEVRAHLLYIPAFTLEGFPLESIPPDHSVPQHLQGEFTLELLGLSSPRTHLKPTSSPRPHLKHQVHTRTRNTANTHVRLLKAQRWNFGDHNYLIT